MNLLLKKIASTFVFLFWFGTAIAQGPISDIRSSIEAGNIAGITRYFDRDVSLVLVGSQGNYSRSQAEMVLRDFFSKNAPKSFRLEHNGGNENLKYGIGTLSTSTGNYKAYFSVKLKPGGYVIQEIRIER